MKTRLSLTLDEDLVNRMKRLAAKNGTSISELVKEFFSKLTKPKQKNIIDIIEKLNKPSITVEADLKELYYKERGQPS